MNRGCGGYSFGCISLCLKRFYDVSGKAGNKVNRFFNVNGDCKPEFHYMVNIQPKLAEIKKMVDKGEYFTINCARQYGKTTTLRALDLFLKKEYLVISLDFQIMSHANFKNEEAFASAFSSELLDSSEAIPQDIREKLVMFMEGTEKNGTLMTLFRVLSSWCSQSEKPVVLMIDEVDSAANNQVFMDFLAQLRGYYINRDRKPTFHSVILAGVYDIKNIKQKIGSHEHKVNSPWNIAADFLVDMCFSARETAGMLEDYENDHHTGMRIEETAKLLYAYTSGYPYLVSRLCKLMDERIGVKEESAGGAWTKECFLQAVRVILAEPNMLFESLLQKLKDDPELDHMLRALLFAGKEITYVVGIHPVEMALMFGFVKVFEGQVLVANRIFETLLYNFFLAVPSMQQEEIYDTAQKEKTLFIEDGHLNMKMVLERFVVHFDSLYGDRGQKFYEEDGRRYFMLFLKPIINGTGNCYVEAETRNRERTDLVVDYCGEQFIVETKIWHGAARHMQGQQQLFNYLDHYHLKKGYLLIFNFNKKKEIGVKKVVLEDKVLIRLLFKDGNK